MRSAQSYRRWRTNQSAVGRKWQLLVRRAHSKVHCAPSWITASGEKRTFPLAESTSAFFPQPEANSAATIVYPTVGGWMGIRLNGVWRAAGHRSAPLLAQRILCFDLSFVPDGPQARIHIKSWASSIRITDASVLLCPPFLAPPEVSLE